jgi:hypothetical protein
MTLRSGPPIQSERIKDILAEHREDVFNDYGGQNGHSRIFVHCASLQAHSYTHRVAEKAQCEEQYQNDF